MGDRKTKCDVCGFDCEMKCNSGNYSEVGVEINIMDNAIERDRIQKMFGRTEFVLCWCCWLKSMGFVPQS